ncbi:MAG: hypothetical protein ABIQ12_10780 [Opitutaceae bacterium]
MSKRSVLALFPLFVAFATRLTAISYFVDFAGGSDENHGTGVDAPWKHCPGDAAASGRAAVCLLVPGDVVIFKGGVTYVFEGAAGIALKASGEPRSPIFYDGNSGGDWGVGRARFSDNRGSGRITAFSAADLVRNVVFKSLEIGPMGGAAELPPDPGVAALARYGGGFSFAAGCQGVLIADCALHDLGYAFNQKPMNAAAIAGTAITVGDAVREVTISRCEFSRMAVALDFARATVLTGVEIADSEFAETLVWPMILPTMGGTTTTTALAMRDTKLPWGSFFAADKWSGYDLDPRTDQFVVREGESITLVASALALPEATFVWKKAGVIIEGATAFEFRLAKVTDEDAGTFTVVATNSEGSASSNSAVLVVTPRLASTDERPSPVPASPVPPASTAPPPVVPAIITSIPPDAEPANRKRAPLNELGLRTLAGDAETATVTFSVGGGAPRQVLIRAAGPTLTLLGLNGAIGDPQIALFGGDSLLASNDDWGGSDVIRAAASRLGTFPFESAASKDAALLVTLESGDYRVVTTDGNAGGGFVLIEIRELP